MSSILSKQSYSQTFAVRFFFIVIICLAKSSQIDAAGHARNDEILFQKEIPVAKGKHYVLREAKKRRNQPVERGRNRALIRLNEHLDILTPHIRCYSA